MLRFDRIVFRSFTRVSDDDDPEMVVDGSVTPVAFRVVNPVGCHPFGLHHISMAMSAGAQVWPNDGPLTNGLLVRMLDTDMSTVLIDWTGGGTGRKPITRLEDFALVGAETPRWRVLPEPSTNITWPLHDVIGGGGVRIGAGQAIEILIRDKLDTMTYFRAQAHGTCSRATDKD